MRDRTGLRLLGIFILLATTSAFRGGERPLAAIQAVYSDSLAAGWENWSWDVGLDFAASSPVHSGSHSLRLVYSSPWSGLFLHKANLDSAGLTDLRFFVHGGGSGGQRFNVYLNLDGSQVDAGDRDYPVTVGAASAWSEVVIPLSLLNPENAPITGLTFQEARGTSQPALYLDDLRFSSNEDPNGPALSQASVAPRSLPADGTSVLALRVAVSDPQGAADIAGVTLDAAGLGRGTLALRDDGRSNDGAAGDGVYGAALTVAPGIPAGEQRLLVSARDQDGHTASLSLGMVTVLAKPGGSIPAGLPQRFGWGSNAWSETPGEDWQVNSGVPWNYVYQYITYGWEDWGGHFVQRFVQQAWSKDYIPVVTVYIMLGTPPTTGEGGAQYAAKLQDAGMVARYLTSFENALAECHGSRPVIFVLEPDFYGYMQQLSNDPNNRPPGVRPNDPSSYPVTLNKSGYPNTLAGFGRYLVDRIHAVLPNGLAGPEVSMWGVNGDPQTVTAADAQSMAQTTADFVGAMGGAQADLLVVEWSDRDAGRGIRPWWDDTDHETPRPTRAILWENALSSAAGKRLLLWQIPVGNMSLDNSENHYQDNRAAYAFSHTRDLFEAGVFGLVFGGGDGVSTQVDTDGGFVAAQGAIAYADPAAPQGLSQTDSAGSLAGLRWDENGEPDLWKYQVVAALSGTGVTLAYDSGRRNALTLLLPYAGTWELRVRAIDAMGNPGLLSAALTAEVSVSAEQTYLPWVAH